MIKGLIVAFIAMFGIGNMLFAEQVKANLTKKQQPLRREKLSAKGENAFAQRRMWRAFNEMSPQERGQMRKLQSSNPEEFKKVMQERVKQIETREKEQQDQLDSIVKRYKEATTIEQKNLCKQELSSIIKKRYLKRLEYNRNHIEELRKRVKKLDEELTQREQNAEQFIDKQTEQILKNPESTHPKKRANRGVRKHRK